MSKLKQTLIYRTVLTLQWPAGSYKVEIDAFDMQVSYVLIEEKTSLTMQPSNG